MVPPVPSHKQKYAHYYDFNVTSIAGIPIKYVDYEGKNEHHSYDQWIQGYLAYPDFDYFMIVEDDYTIDLSNIHFDHEFVSMYQDTFSNNIGYLSQLVWQKPLVHAAISNGMLSKETFLALGPDPLKEYYSTHYYCQLNFSVMFDRFKIEHRDTSKQHIVSFYHTHPREIILFVDGTEDQKHKCIITCQEADISSNYSRMSAEECWKTILHSLPFHAEPQEQEIIKQRYVFMEKPKEK